MHSSSFIIKKWYFDSADKQGDLLIGYAGTVKWRSLKLAFSSVLQRMKNEEPQTISSLKKTNLPEEPGERLEYDNPLFSVELKRLHDPLRETLIETEKGKIEWFCHFPSADSRISTKENTVEGSGYAEELIMTIKPWEFKIGELYWGRFVSEKTYITWIEWRGEWKQLIIYHNGVKYTSGTITETGVGFEAGTLSFHKPEVLRSGSLLSTVFKKLPLIKTLFPLKALMIDETKWFSKGIFMSGNETEEGYCVFEKVIWL